MVAEQLYAVDRASYKFLDLSCSTFSPFANQTYSFNGEYLYRQYLNCKILHGGTLCNLDQTSVESM